MQDDIKKCLDILFAGGIILYPTDTIWGLGCDATNPAAVERIYSIKQRHDAKSLIILVDTPQRIPSYISQVPDIAYELIELTTKPLTLVLDGAKNLAPALIASDGSVAVRVASDQFCKTLISKFRKPVVSTSANISGKPFPESFSQIEPEIAAKADYVVQFRRDELTPGKPSGIIKIDSKGVVKVIRE